MSVVAVSCSLSLWERVGVRESVHVLYKHSQHCTLSLWERAGGEGRGLQAITRPISASPTSRTRIMMPRTHSVLTPLSRYDTCKHLALTP